MIRSVLENVKVYIHTSVIIEEVIKIFKVVIIDDEALVRIGLKSMISWEEQGFELAGEASNGQYGYELIKSIKPDIVITDIKMPVMDGLEMIQRLQEEDLKPKFIILSSYDEFDLVRRAMKLGIEDYIIKLELEPDILTSTLLKLKEKLILDYKRQDEEYKTQKYMRSSQYAMREEFFKRVIGNVLIDEEEIREECSYLQIKLNEEGIICMVIQITNSGKFKSYKESDINLLEFSVLNIVDEIVKDFFTGYSFKWTVDEYIVVFSKDSTMEENNIRSKIDDMSTRINTMLKQYFNINVAISVSDMHKGISSIGTSYLECLKALRRSFYTGWEKVIYFKDVDEVDSSKKDLSLYEVDSLLKYIEANDLEAIEIVFQNIIERLEREEFSKEKAYDLCANIAYLIKIAAGEDEKALELIFGSNGSIFENVLSLASIQDIALWLRKIEKGIGCYLAGKGSDQSNKIISMAKKFVRENVGKTISLQEVANDLSISPGYLSTIFKQATGISFIDYVTDAKIDLAKRLLKESNLKIYQIAEMTGYENAYYFSKVFKKVTGITPREFVMKGI